MKTIGNHNYYVYILTNKKKTVLYTGITNNLKERYIFIIIQRRSLKHSQLDIDVII
ncbi:GIY-YIG nuclease family protein [Flaviramulus aquimarinus]|uniref:GIY-YIG nuclease family protein n=1 Tax=Flaviramulus aquimarinus TaxID=1170456 RepID=UPI0031E7C66F